MPRLSAASRLLALAALPAGACLATAVTAAELFAGGYSFSDELGGFRLVSVSGSGTSSDPIVIAEELPGTDPVVLVVRRHNGLASGFYPLQDRLTLVKEVVNRSGRVWAGYDVELQEILKTPSSRADGLSFNQAGAQPADIESNAFAHNERRFEPFDRISFEDGFVDPDATLRLRLTITDPTPVPEFYVLQDPSLLSAALPAAGRSFAARAE